ncbi:MAG TPA: anti-sigma factor [Solirubrobacteraceae bacterium]|jgi:anti-sigma-K factor RskA|nr:anti-sigma factor [Solirubrobacteraceae bacterium]
MSGTPDCGGDAAAYALGALEPQEAEAFRVHMHECAVCRDEVEALGGVIQALPMAAHQYPPPRGLKRRLMREVWHAQSAAGRAGRAGRAGARWRAQRRSPRGLQAGLAAAVLAAGGVIAGIELTAGAAVTVIQAQVSGVAGSAQLRLTNGHAELVVRHLTPPGQGHVYEVWLKSGRASPVPASVLFGVNSSGNADVGIPRRIRGVSAVMVTQERLGGAPRPTHAPVIVAPIA